MSSFFTAPRAQKRKRPDAPKDGPKKRLATSSTPSFSRRASGGGSAPRTNGRAPPKSGDRSRTQRRPPTDRDSSISGSDSDSDSFSPDPDDVEGASSSSDGEEGETIADRRIRLAEQYLEGTRKEVQDEYGFDAEDIDRDLLAERLQEDVAETKGKVYRRIADTLDFSQISHTQFRWNSNTVTSVATCPPYLYTVSGGKDSALIKWRIQDMPRDQFPQTTRKKPKKADAPPRKKPERLRTCRSNPHRAKDKMWQGHTGAILTVAASGDGRFVATGGSDRRLVVYDAETLKPLRAFPHHRDAVTGLAFRRGTNQLYSSSKDRTVKVWSLDELAYVETLFGHQDDVVDIDALAQERCVSVGARDRTARLWKVVEETQLLFRGGGGASSDRKFLKHQADIHDNNATTNGMSTPKIDPNSLAHEGSIDRITLLSDDLFITGSDNGSLSLWSISKKKPLFIIPRAHGLDPPLRLDQASAETNPDPEVIPPPQPRWITALRSVPYSDLVLSGSWDGWVRVWRLSVDQRRIESAGVLGKAPTQASDLGPARVNGVVNGDAKDPRLNGTPLKPLTASEAEPSSPGPVKGIINDITIFERGDRGKDGLCVVAAVGKEHRLGRWIHDKKGRNGAMVFEVPRKMLAKTGKQTKQVNGVEHAKKEVNNNGIVEEA